MLHDRKSYNELKNHSHVMLKFPSLTKVIGMSYTPYIQHLWWCLFLFKLILNSDFSFSLTGCYLKTIDPSQSWPIVWVLKEKKRMNTLYKQKITSILKRIQASIKIETLSLITSAALIHNSSYIKQSCRQCGGYRHVQLSSQVQIRLDFVLFSSRQCPWNIHELIFLL